VNSDKLHLNFDSGELERYGLSVQESKHDTIAQQMESKVLDRLNICYGDQTVAIICLYRGRDIKDTIWSMGNYRYIVSVGTVVPEEAYTVGECFPIMCYFTHSKGWNEKFIERNILAMIGTWMETEGKKLWGVK
jgi:hypothetical protein